MLNDENEVEVCTWGPEEACQDCELSYSLNCRMDYRALAYFGAIFLPGGISAAAGMIRGGFTWGLLLWAGYMLVFFNIWEAKVLCSHCPYYAGNGRTLRCPANYGVFKIWPYQPGPMSRSEKIQFLVGAGLLLMLPWPFLALGGEYLLLGLTAAANGSFVFSLVRTVCPRCVNFSCPLNRVPVEIQRSYLAKNPQIKEAWTGS